MTSHRNPRPREAGQTAAGFERTVQERTAEEAYEAALAARREGNWQDSLGHLQQAVRLDPQVAKFHADVGATLFMLRRTGEAVSAYERALELDPAHLNSLNNLAVIYSLTLRHPEAEALLHRSLELDPGQPEAWLNLCSTVSELHYREVDAASYARHAIELLPKDPRGYRYLAKALLHQGDPSGALSALETAISLDPRNPDNHCSLGICRIQLDQIAEAVQSFQTALAIDPNHGDTYYALAEFLYRIDELTAAEEAARNALEFLGDRIAADILLARILFAQARFEEGRDSFVRARSLQKQRHKAYSRTPLPDTTIVLAPVDSVEHWCEAHRLPCRETIPASAWRANKPIVFGVGEADADIPAAPLPHAYVAEVDHATVMPGHEVILVDEERVALYDRLVQMRDWHLMREDSVVPLIANDHVLAEIGAPDPHRVRAGIFLFSEGWYNYAHWLIEQLPRLYSVEKFAEYDGLPVLINDGLYPQQMESLRLVCGNRYPVKILAGSRRHRIDRLIYPTNLAAYHKRRFRPGERATAADGPFHPEAIRFLRDRLMPQCAADAKPTRRLWLSRATQKKTGQRRLVNEAEIEALFTAKGFESVFPEKLSFAQQVRLFAEAEMIAGPGGAAMMNIVFAPPGARTLIFTKRHPEVNFHYFTNIGQVIGHEVAHICGEPLQNIGVLGFETDFTVGLADAQEAMHRFFGL